MFRKLAATISLLIFSANVEAQTKIGVIVPLTSEVGIWGTGIRRGLELAEASNHDTLKFIYEDESFCNSAKAVTAAKKLIEQDKVSFLITGCLNGTKAIQPIAAKANIPILSAGLLDTESFQKSSGTLSISAQIGTEAKYIAQILSAEKAKVVALVRHDDAFTHEFFTQLQGALEKTGGSSLRDVAIVDTTFPWESEITKLRTQKLDAYVVYLGNDELISFMKARKKLQDTTPVYSGYVLESNFDAKKFGSLMDGVRYTYPAMAAEDDPSRRTFERHFAKRFGPDERPTVNTYFSFDGMEVLVGALNSCRPSDTACLAQFFYHEGRERSGVSGAFTYSRNGEIDRPFLLKEVKDGQFVFVKKS